MNALFELFLTFFKIGLFTFGGGYAMISQIKENVVEKNKWLTDDELVEIIAIAEATPGPIAINMVKKMKKKPYHIIAFSSVLCLMILFELFAVSFSAIYFILIGGAMGIVLYSVLNIEKEAKK